jgi:hypothetical protein
MLRADAPCGQSGVPTSRVKDVVKEARAFDVAGGTLLSCRTALAVAGGLVESAAFFEVSWTLGIAKIQSAPTYSTPAD